MNIKIKKIFKELISLKENRKEEISMDNNDKYGNLIIKEIDYSKLNNANYTILNNYLKVYREYLLERGYMTLSQLIAFDVNECISSAKKSDKHFELSEEDWMVLTNKLYAEAIKYKDYVKNGIYLSLFNPKEEKDEQQ